VAIEQAEGRDNVLQNQVDKVASKAGNQPAQDAEGDFEIAKAQDLDDAKPENAEQLAPDAEDNIQITEA
jgi:hypothetical protein